MAGVCNVFIHMYTHRHTDRYTQTQTHTKTQTHMYTSDVYHENFLYHISRFLIFTI